MKTLKLAAAAGALIVGGMAGAHATPSYNVQVWIGSPKDGIDSSTIADAAHQPTGPVDASFTYNGAINWSTTNSANRVADFLPIASISGFSSPSGAYANVTDFGAESMSASHDPYAAYFKITGIYSAPIGGFRGSVSHDDGASLYVDGTTAAFTSAAETTDKLDKFTLPAGTHSFELDYVEGNGSPSILHVTFPDATSVPEPMTLTLLATGLIGLGAARHRKAA